jgi:outer membrane protein
MQLTVKKIGLVFLLSVSSFVVAQAQKFALVDMEYIMKHIPAYESANDQLDILSKKWQIEVDAAMQNVENMNNSYQTEVVFLSPEMKTKRENEIIAQKKAAQDLKIHYFGPNGELFKKRESLIKPIQDEIYNAIQSISNDQGYQLVLDKTSAMNIIFSSPKLDISDDVLSKLGYSK